MALTKSFIKSSSHAKQYFARHLSQFEYYGKTLGVWQGPGVELLGLERDVTKEAFERVIDSQHPITGQRLTPRMNTTRREMVWKQNQQTKLWEQVEVEVENRRIGLDLTFSMPKSASVYYGLTKDKDVDKHSPNYVKEAFVNQHRMFWRLDCLGVGKRTFWRP